MLIYASFLCVCPLLIESIQRNSTLEYQDYQDHLDHQDYQDHLDHLDHQDYLDELYLTDMTS